MTIAPVRAGDFINSIGVVAQLGAANGAPKAQATVAAFGYLGITNVRTTLSAALVQTGSVADKLAQAGVHFDVLLGGARPLAETLGNAALFAKGHVGAIAALEGPNEINNWPITFNGIGGVDAGVAFVGAMGAGARANPLLAGAALYDFTGAPRSSATMSDAAGYANIHPYPQGGVQPFDWLKARVLTHAVPGKGMVITETGYTTTAGQTGFEGVDQTVQAKMTLNLLADATLLGVSKTYLYQLVDGGQAGTAEAGFGLFDAKLQPKRAATAIHNLTSILADPAADGASFAPHALDYTIAGLPAGAHSLLIEKANGTYELMIWAEPKIWDGATDKAIAVTPNAVTVTLGGGPGELRLFDPLLSDQAQAVSHDARSMTVNVSDHLVILEIAGLAPGAIVAPAHFDPPMQLVGSAAADLMYGGSGVDILFGLGGADTIGGGDGADRIVGGVGADVLTGGHGADTFVFQTAADSKPAVADRDTISDFSSADGDRIDLSLIDASIRAAGNQAFRLGGDHFTGHAGELIQTAADHAILLQGDLNGDGRADFAILLAGLVHPLGADAFIF